ncbi:MAG: hypothetical protein IT355_10980 [Gemmatimonadaceae bacterium]|nr:hypothetical protein [Gemmatimonadaceae bacterium]
MTTSVMQATEEASSIAIGELVTELERVFGDTLRVVLKFGSAVAGEVLPHQSDTNLLVIVDALPLDLLIRKAAAVQKWTAAGNPPPLLLTLDEWRSSADIFAMEYADILHRHQVLVGDPPFAGVAVDAEDLRLHVEREAMGKLLQLRRAVMAVGDNQRHQLQMLVNGLSTLMVLFRGVSRVAGQPPAMDYRQLSRDVAALAGFDARPFDRLVQHARTDVQIPLTDVTPVLLGVLDAMGRLVAYLNRVGGSTRSASAAV